VRLALGLFVLGALLLFPFEYTLTLVAGNLLLIGSIVAGAFALATPERLSGDD
jgi:hypothetical protein